VEEITDIADLADVADVAGMIDFPNRKSLFSSKSNCEDLFFIESGMRSEEFD